MMTAYNKRIYASLADEQKSPVVHVSAVVPG